MDNNLENAITGKIILVYLNISVWTGARRDKALGKETSRRKGASDDAVSVTKYLVDKSMIDFVVNKANAIRRFNYENTVSWDDNGGRALPVEKWFDYEANIAPLIAEFHDACEQFSTWYADNWNLQQNRLGDMFDVSDYPYPDEIRHKFRMKTSFRPIATPDFRTELPDEIREAVRDSMQAGMQDGLKMATQECWARIADVTQKVYATLSEPKKIFRDSLIENVEVLCETLAPLNVANDSVLSDTLDELNSGIGRAIPELFRIDPAARERAAALARKIYDVAMLHTA